MRIVSSTTAVRLAVLVMLIGGWFGFAGVFSDRGPGETLFERGAVVLGMQGLAGLVAGFLLPRSWYISLLGAWGSLLCDLILLISLFRGHLPSDHLIVNVEELNMPGWAPIAAPVFTLALGYVAARVRLAWSGKAGGKWNRGGTLPGSSA